LQLGRKVKWDEKMAVYAAMVDELDQNVGRLVDYLQSKGQLDNTVFIFLSDNGASNETITNAGFTPEIRAANEFPASHPRSFTAYGIEGAAVSNTPFKKFKHWEFEGGNATGFIAYGPKFLPQGKQFDRPAHLIDIMPTLAQWSGASYPKDYAGNTIQPMEGLSLLPLWAEQQKDIDREICFEHEGNKAVRKGKWKLVSSYPGNRWYLYDIEKDRSETVDLSASFPKIYSEMVQIYENWAKRVGVIPYEQLAQKKGNSRYE
jgi:Arylsulfatase A and related enzymes